MTTENTCYECGNDLLRSVPAAVRVVFETTHADDEGIQGDEVVFCSEDCLQRYLHH